jgi:hypothetical protein
MRFSNHYGVVIVFPIALLVYVLFEEQTEPWVRYRSILTLHTFFLSYRTVGTCILSNATDHKEHIQSPKNLDLRLERVNRDVRLAIRLCTADFDKD